MKKRIIKIPGLVDGEYSHSDLTAFCLVELIKIRELLEAKDV